MRRFFLTVLLIAASVGCAARARDAEPTDRPPTPHAPITTPTPSHETATPAHEMPAPPRDARPARVVHVTDGDTIVLSGIDVGEVHRQTGGRKARFIGVDTPEVFGDAECYGRQAALFTEDALEGDEVLVGFDVDPLDRYGRALVYVWESDGTFFNGRLAAEGFALQMTVPPNVRYVELLTDLVAQARNANEGLWAGCFE